MPRHSLAVFQVVEYLRAFLGGRLGWSWLNGLLIISGAFGTFRTDVLRTIGGYSRQAVGEDMDLVVRIHRHFREHPQPYRIVFVPDPVCWTEVPTSLQALRSQRRRWQRGLAQIFARHRSFLFRPSAGVVFFLAMPYFVLELLSPVVELAGLLIMPLGWWLGYLDGRIFVAYLIAAFLLSTLFAVWAVMIEEFTYRRYVAWRDFFRLLLFAVGEILGYHQLHLWFRLEGTYDYLRGRGQWGEQKRAGFDRPTPSKA
jgi:cellulose synthase/poly-beta-1,6-N-acetylglucosamine synthase-like glycosyltransferase